MWRSDEIFSSLAPAREPILISIKPDSYRPWRKVRTSFNHFSLLLCRKQASKRGNNDIFISVPPNLIFFSSRWRAFFFVFTPSTALFPHFHPFALPEVVPNQRIIRKKKAPIPLEGILFPVLFYETTYFLYLLLNNYERNSWPDVTLHVTFVLKIA